MIEICFVAFLFLGLILLMIGIAEAQGIFVFVGFVVLAGAFVLLMAVPTNETPCQTAPGAIVQWRHYQGGKYPYYDADIAMSTPGTFCQVRDRQAYDTGIGAKTNTALNGILVTP